MNPKVWWYLARASGLTAWGLAAITLAWGLLMSTRLFARWSRPAWVLDLHRTFGALMVAFVAVHMGGLFADHYVHFSPAQLLVPFATHWRPGAVAWGIVAFYLLVAVEVTSLLRRHLPMTWWRRLHRASIAIFPLGTIHALKAGADSGPLFRAVALWVSAALVLLGLVRLLTAKRARRLASPPLQGREPGASPLVPPSLAWTPRQTAESSHPRS